MLRKIPAHFLTGLGILGGAILVTLLLVLLRPDPPTVEPSHVPPLVTVTKPAAHQGHLTVRGNGTVRSVREITLLAEVAGRITWVSNRLVTGGRFRKGEVLLRIDSTDYANAVAMTEAEVIQRRFALVTTEEEMVLAREEWERLEARLGARQSPDTTALGNLALKEPHQKAAAALLRSAEARLANARARLERTQVRAPFNGLVHAKTADLGQYVGPGQALATFYGTDTVEILVPLSSHDAALLGDVWRNSRPRAQATVTADYGGRTHAWEGYVHRTEGALDQSTRTLGVVVRVNRPYATTENRPPLWVGTFVSVQLEGMALDTYWSLPREALREGNMAWVVRSGRLRMVPVQPIQEVENTVYVTEGVTEDDTVVTSALLVATDSMQVRTGGN